MPRSAQSVDIVPRGARSCRLRSARVAWVLAGLVFGALTGFGLGGIQLGRADEPQPLRYQFDGADDWLGRFDKGGDAPPCPQHMPCISNLRAIQMDF